MSRKAIMKEIVKGVHGAGSYTPITILIDEGSPEYICLMTGLLFAFSRTRLLTVPASGAILLGKNGHRLEAFVGQLF